MNARLPADAVLFAGAGGSCEGIRRATGFSPWLAINHNPVALQAHALNHPETRHLCEDVFEAQPWRVWPKAQPLRLLWASPDCTDFSRAKGGAPVSSGRRSLAWVVADWVAQTAPRIVMLENVPEFEGWGPLAEDGRRDPERAGETFAEFVQMFKLHGYRVDWRVLRACDYGAPTIRRRLYLIARRDRVTPRWPEPTHGPGCPLPWRTAAECIDWSLPGRSIFGRSRPLASATMARIAEGFKRFVVDCPRPFLLNLSHGGRLEPIDEPMRTITATPDGGDRALVVPWFQETANGERQGQAPRVRSIDLPTPTVTATGSQGAIGCAWLESFYSSALGGRALDEPMPAVTGGGRHEALAFAWLAKHYTGATGSDLRAPIGTVTAQDHHSLCAAFVTSYYSGGGTAQPLSDPMAAVVTRARHGLVVVELGGQPYALRDITLRMLAPRELATAQGFGPDYQLVGTIAQQIAQVGNSVCPPVAEALVRANLG